MIPSFDLLTQPWLPCLPLDSQTPVPLSLPQALTKAHNYREVVADSPLVAVALHRLLLAVLHRAYMGPRNPDEWHAVRSAGRFDADRVQIYLNDSRWRTHFDLFDPHRPFYQVPEMEDTEPVSAAKLATERASGNNITLFDHTTGDTMSFSPAEGARYLVAFQLYAMSGGVNQPFNFTDGPLARDYTALVRGATLFETLMLNLLRYDDELPYAFGHHVADDSAWWERERDPEPDPEGTMPRGYCDYLTWQSRRVHLLYDEADGVIRRCQVRQNLKLSSLAASVDPFKAYRQDAKDKRVSRRLDERKAVWRDSHALLEEAHNDGSRPELFQWLATLFPARRPGSALSFTFDVIGYRTDGPTGPVILWRRERLPLPLSYLAPHGKSLRDELHSGLEAAENIGRLFGTGHIQVKQESGKSKGQRSPVWVLAKEMLTMSPERKPDTKDIVGLADHLAAERSYWASVETPFRHVMRNLASEPTEGRTLADHLDTILTNWKEELRSIARHTFREIIASLESDVRSLRAAALAQRQFNWLLNEILPAPEPNSAAVVMREQSEVRA